MSKQERIQQLLDRARAEFGEDFDRGKIGVDTAFFTAMASGTVAQYPIEDAKGAQISDETSAAARKTLKADRIEWLCALPDAAAVIHRRGIQVEGATIAGKLDLADIHLERGIALERCKVDEGIVMDRASFGSVAMTGSTCKHLSANYLRVLGPLRLNAGFTANEGVVLRDAVIEGLLSFNGATFTNEIGNALNADGMSVKGDVFMSERFQAKGEVRLLGATIGGVLNCEGASFQNENGSAFSADRMKVDGSVFMSKGFKAKGEVRLLGATIGGQLICNGASLGKNEKGYAFIADSVTVNADVFMSEGFQAKGEVRLPGATIGGQLNCNGASFQNENGYALSADRMKVNGGVFMNKGFQAKGEVRLLGATIGGQLSCAGASFQNEKGDAFSGDSMRVGDSVFLSEKFRSAGTVRLQGARIDGSLILRDVLPDPKFALNLEHAHVHMLDDRQGSWPEPTRLFLHGFTYDYLASGAPHSSEARLDWLARDGRPTFSPQPYGQLASVLAKHGLRDDARRIRIRKEQRIAEAFPPVGLIPRVWTWLWGTFTDFGHRQWKIWPYCVAIWLVGAVFFGLAYENRLIVPTRTTQTLEGFVRSDEPLANYPTFQAFIYSADVFIPLVNLEQTDYWQPNAFRGARWPVNWRYFFSCGGAVIAWYDFEVLAGWLFTTLLVAGLGELIRRAD